MKNKNLIVILLILLLITGCGKKKQEVQQQQSSVNNDIPIEELMTNITEENQGNFTVTDVKISAVGASSVVSGNVTNNSEEEKSLVLTLKMFDGGTMRLFGIVDIDVDNILPHETREFSLSMVGNYDNVSVFDVTVSEK